MKRILLIYILIHCLNLVTASNNDSTVVKEAFFNNPDKEFYLNEHLDVYTFLPTHLGMWKSDDFSSVNAKVSVDDGSFKLVDDFQRDEKFSFNTESVQSFKETGWTFYGRFNLEISDHENANWNLGYERSEIGNPFKLMIEREGDFNVKRYGLVGMLNKEINSKFNVALGVKYGGDLYFRLRDTRNEFYNVRAELVGGLSYTLSNKNRLSFGVSYFYKKGSPAFRNVFNATTENHKLYFNEGMGEFEKIDDPNKEYFLKNSNPKFYISYLTNNKNPFSLSYSIYMGNEKWERKILKEPDPEIYSTHKKMYDYKYSQHNIITSYQINKEKYKAFNCLKVDYVNGEGYRYRGFDEKTLNYKSIKLNASTDLTRPQSKLFYLSKLSINVENTEKQDMLNAQQIKYTNIYAALKTGYSAKLNPLNYITLDVIGAYKYNLNYDHVVASAGSRFYTLYLAHNEVAYNSASYYSAGCVAKWHKNFKNYKGELSVRYNYLKPTDLKVFNSSSYLTLDDYRDFIELGVSVYF